MELYEMHLHTSDTSKCAYSTGEEQAEYFAALGYRGIFITDHFLNGNTRILRNGSISWDEKIHRHFAGYRAAKARGDELGLAVYPGFEYAICDTEYLTYGIDEAFLLAHPDCDKMDPIPYSDMMRAAGGHVFQAHPYRAASYIHTIRLTPWTSEGIEMINSANREPANLLARYYAEAYHLPVIGGSDIHCTDRKDLCALAIFTEAHCPDDIFDEVLADRHCLLDIRVDENEPKVISRRVLYCGANCPEQRKEGEPL